MKHLIIAILAVVIAALPSCIEDDFTTSSSDVLAFSTDTLSFDTVFTGEQTFTRRFLIYNRHKKQLRVERIYLSDMVEGVDFFINVDGNTSKEFSNVEIRGEDSAYVFVEARIDRKNQSLPFDVFAHLNFLTNGVTQSVVLHAAGQDAINLSNYRVERSVVMDSDMPYRVMDSIVVEKGASLSILAGTRLYFHDKARIVVRGTLKMTGYCGKPVTLCGDRLDKVAGEIPFQLMSGQWDGIYFAPESYGNTMKYVEMQGATAGVVVDSCATDRRKLYLLNSMLHNSASSTLKVAHAWVEATGCEFSDSRDGVVDLTGGRYAFNNCTFANYYLFDAITSPILSLYYLLPGQQTGEAPLMQADFNNCIIYGNASDISEGDLTDSQVYLRNCLLRSEGADDDNFIYCVWGGDPKFFTKREDYIFDYRLRNESDAIGMGDPLLCPADALIDRYGNQRSLDSIIDIGAYVWIETKEEN